jgi:putative membrane protein
MTGMRSILVKVVANAGALAVAALLFAGIRIGGSTWSDKLVTLLIVAVVFGVVNTIVGRLVKLLSLPFIVLTLGLLLWVINAAMLLLTAALTDAFSVPFRVDSFPIALGGALVISVVSWVLELALGD